eukprot:Colp12_sorted_trinity150504_noHs@3006
MASNRNSVLIMRVLNFLAMLGIILATVIPKGKLPANANDTWVTPPGWAFSIWGLIYTALCIWVLYQLLPSSYTSETINDGIGYLFLVNAAINITWDFVSRVEHNDAAFYASLVLVWANLANLIPINYRFSKIPVSSFTEYILTRLGFNLYLGWIVLASYICVFLAFGLYSEPQYEAISAVGLVFAALTEIGMGAFLKTPIPPAVGCYGLAAIASKHPDVPAIFYTAIVFAVWCGLSFFAILYYMLRPTYSHVVLDEETESLEAPGLRKSFFDRMLGPKKGDWMSMQ